LSIICVSLSSKNFIPNIFVSSAYLENHAGVMAKMLAKTYVDFNVKCLLLLHDGLMRIGMD
jgi:hypothetical protein